jgi:hypothetical protein
MGRLKTKLRQPYDPVFKDALKIISNATERMDAKGTWMTRAQVKVLVQHLHRVVAVLDEVEKRYEDTVLSEMNVRFLTPATQAKYNDPTERAIQKRYRTKYRRVLEKLLKTKTELTPDQVKVFLRTLDPDSRI